MRGILAEGDLVGVSVEHDSRLVVAAATHVVRSNLSQHKRCPSSPMQAEVHSVLSDGSVMLHARSMQYGKLDNGCLVKVPASLVPRQKQHVLSLPEPVACDVVFGVNGWVWLTGATPCIHVRDWRRCCC